MYIAVNTIEVPNPDMMKPMFRQNAGMMKQFAGFAGLELWSDAGSLKVVTRWENKEAFEAYLNSEFFAKSHGGTRGEDARKQARVEYFDAEVLAE
ncbi:antibiotic biosynthesis monooxygenase family protein [Paenibacillus contaminans]|uniref:Antibiotic biosynthesis monooxygenase n=1 Tax=Paenibacillus contaminans TaxID=450362 RepID=A0A329LY86_9BACL|nr:antibiotic biosynthesis monooxygenase [Paenibacillus contaminans]RAV12664.1 antibiotic biosynthesis monooxygenase [Paenibacillus contaminans]